MSTTLVDQERPRQVPRGQPPKLSFRERLAHWDIKASPYLYIAPFFQVFGLDPVQWQANRIASHLAIAAMVNWRWTGYNALIVLAAMQALPKDVMEAAVVDGAGAVRRFRSVMLPMLRPTLIFIVITST